jgi:hypothetical protein
MNAIEKMKKQETWDLFVGELKRMCPHEFSLVGDNERLYCDEQFDKGECDPDCETCWERVLLRQYED